MTELLTLSGEAEPASNPRPNPAIVFNVLISNFMARDKTSRRLNHAMDISTRYVRCRLAALAEPFETVETSFW